MATQLYNQGGNAKIYPITEATAVTVSSTNYANTKGNVAADLEDLAKRINALSGEGESFSGLHIEVKYCTLNSDSVETAKAHSQWENDFQNPTLNKKYAWKRTKFSLTGYNDTYVYEIVTTYPTPYKIRMLFCVNSTPVCNLEIPYVNTDTNEIEWIPYSQDLNNDNIDWNSFEYGNSPGVIHNKQWSDSPPLLGSLNKYLFMTIQDTNDKGTWNNFKNIPGIIGYYDDGTNS